jgi:hypothetical protein
MISFNENTATISVMLEASTAKVVNALMSERFKRVTEKTGFNQIPTSAVVTFVGPNALSIDIPVEFFDAKEEERLDQVPELL